MAEEHRVYSGENVGEEVRDRGVMAEKHRVYSGENVGEEVRDRGVMAEKHPVYSGENVGEEVRDRGMFDFLGKKKEAHEGHEGEGKCQEEALVTEFENKVQVNEKEEKKGSLLEKLHRSHSSSSSSSSDEEDVAEGEGEKKKKKKSLTDKIKEKISAGEKKEEFAAAAPAPAPVAVEDNTIPVEKIDELDLPESDQAQEKKSLLDKIKEKLPGGKKPAEEAAAPVAPEQCADQGKEHHEGDSPKEKKGILGKIMDKIPGYHKGTGPEEGGAAAH